jgi:hypothetical protein
VIGIGRLHTPNHNQTVMVCQEKIFAFSNCARALPTPSIAQKGDHNLNCSPQDWVPQVTGSPRTGLRP